MSKYTKPTISLVALNASPAAYNCSNSTGDANEILDILESMGYNIDNAFGMYEDCKEPVMFEDYCKFTSSIQIFFS